jgi:hypothetical protein
VGKITIENKQIDNFILNMFNDHLLNSGHITKEQYDQIAIKLNSGESK